MSDDPQKNTTERAHRVRERAYRLWEADGRPEGREQEYWERAEAMEKARSKAGRARQPTEHRTGAPQFSAVPRDSKVGRTSEPSRYSAVSSSRCLLYQMPSKAGRFTGSRSPRSTLTVLSVGVPKSIDLMVKASCGCRVRPGRYPASGHHAPCGLSRASARSKSRTTVACRRHHAS